MKVVLYTNILTPYRRFLYDLMHEACKNKGNEFIVLVMADGESNRSWKYSDYKTSYTELLPGITFTKYYVHINKGLLSALKKISPDIVIAGGSYLCPGVWAVAKNKRKLGYKVLYWNESHLGEHRSYHRLKKRIRERVRQAFFPMFDGFLYPGQLALELIRTYSKTNSLYISLPNLVDNTIYTDLEYEEQELVSSLKKEGKVVFFSPARLQPQKGLSEFMDLIAQVNNKDKAAFVVAGKGELKESLEVKSNALSLNFYFVGEKEPNEIANFYSQSDIVLLPSVSDPNPLTCVEALWSKKPLLISNHCGNYPEVVEQGINGYVFSYDDIDGAREIVTTIIDSDEDWRISAGAHSYNIALKEYNPVAVTARVMREIEQML